MAITDIKELVNSFYFVGFSYREVSPTRVIFTDNRTEEQKQSDLEFFHGVDGYEVALGYAQLYFKAFGALDVSTNKSSITVFI